MILSSLDLKEIPSTPNSGKFLRCRLGLRRDRGDGDLRRRDLELDIDEDHRPVGAAPLVRRGGQASERQGPEGAERPREDRPGACPACSERLKGANPRGSRYSLVGLADMFLVRGTPPVTCRSCEGGVLGHHRLSVQIGFEVGEPPVFAGGCRK